MSSPKAARRTVTFDSEFPQEITGTLFEVFEVIFSIVSETGSIQIVTSSAAQISCCGRR